jgi:hypothetical protein
LPQQGPSIGLISPYGHVRVFLQITGARDMTIQEIFVLGVMTYSLGAITGFVIRRRSHGGG